MVGSENEVSTREVACELKDAGVYCAAVSLVDVGRAVFEDVDRHRREVLELDGFILSRKWPMQLPRRNDIECAGFDHLVTRSETVLEREQRLKCGWVVIGSW